MVQTTVRITEATRQTLRELAAADRASMQAVLERAVEDYRRRRFLENVNAGYAALRSDATAWSEHERERDALDRIGDGLERDGWEEAPPRIRRRARKAR